MFGDEIRKYMASKGITQAHIAKKLNLSNQTFNYILNNPKTLKVEDYNKICTALGVPFDFFICADSASKPNKTDTA